MNLTRQTEITQALLDLSRGADNSHPSVDRLMVLVYADLHRIAKAYLCKERRDHTLQPTALVHEAYLRLVDQSRARWSDRAHFLGIAARVMRQVLVDHARRRGAAKRGGDLHRVTLDSELLDPGAGPGLELLALDEAMDGLAEEDARMGRIAEFRVFGGMTSREIAIVEGLTERTIASDWKMARAWLSRALEI